MGIPCKLRKIIENRSHYILHKIIYCGGLLMVFGLLFWGGYYFLLDKAEYPIPILTFFGGLIGASILKAIFHIATRPRLKIETWVENPKDLIWNDGNYKCFKVRVKNNSSFSATNCQIKINLNYTSKDIREYKTNTGTKNPDFYDSDFAPYICNRDQMSSIDDENLLWDIQPHGKNPLEINIPPHSSYLVTIARSYEDADGTISYFKILSEGTDDGGIKARVYLEDNANPKPRKNKNGKPPKEYYLTIKILGFNFYPIVKDALLKNLNNRI